MNRIGSRTRIIGLVALIVVGLACGAEEKQDPANEGPTSGENISPVIAAGSPVANLTYEGAVYYGNSPASDDPKFNEDDLELVGVSESNQLVPGSATGWDIYGLKGGEEGYVYTFSPGQNFLNEDGRTITIKPKWVRWFVLSDFTPLCTPTPPAAC